jgi:hypothetical protein
MCIKGGFHQSGGFEEKIRMLFQSKEPLSIRNGSFHHSECLGFQNL